MFVFFARIFAFVFLIAGCATAYKGSGPDFNLKHAQAESEIKKFSLSEDFWSQGPYLEMGVEHNAYTRESVLPIVKSTSSTAAARFSRAEDWQHAGLISLGVGVTALVAGFVASDSSTRNAFFTLSLLGSGSSILMSFVWRGIQSGAASEYNRDLRNHFAPKLGMNITF